MFRFVFSTFSFAFFENRFSVVFEDTLLFSCAFVMVDTNVARPSYMAVFVFVATAVPEIFEN